VVRGESLSLQSTGRATAQRRPGVVETAVGAALLAVSLVGAAFAAVHPAPNAFDRWGFDAIGSAIGSSALLRITDIGSPVILVVATAGAGLVALRHDRVRAVACLCGPAAVAVLVELVVKPVVGRQFEGVLSYPSGNVADVAAVATAWTVAVTPRFRPFVAIIGAATTLAMAYAVIGLRWHYPSDALGGLVLGVAVVVFGDGLLHLGTSGTRTTPLDRPPT
jgi:membrane-associated phospholipid phosphatase